MFAGWVWRVGWCGVLAFRWFFLVCVPLSAFVWVFFLRVGRAIIVVVSRWLCRVCSRFVFRVCAGVVSVGFSGSRSLSPAASAALSALLPLVPVGVRVSVGCARGVDLACRSFFAGSSSLLVFSVASGRFGAGRSAFARRSCRCVSSVAAGSRGLLVVVPAGACPAGVAPSRSFSGRGSGSWGSLAFALGRGSAGAAVAFPWFSSSRVVWCFLVFGFCSWWLLVVGCFRSCSRAVVAFLVFLLCGFLYLRCDRLSRYFLPIFNYSSFNRCFHTGRQSQSHLFIARLIPVKLLFETIFSYFGVSPWSTFGHNLKSRMSIYISTSDT